MTKKTPLNQLRSKRRVYIILIRSQGSRMNINYIANSQQIIKKKVETVITHIKNVTRFIGNTFALFIGNRLCGNRFTRFIDNGVNFTRFIGRVTRFIGSVNRPPSNLSSKSRLFLTGRTCPVGRSGLPQK